MKDWHRNIIIIWISKTFSACQQYEQTIKDQKEHKIFNLTLVTMSFTVGNTEHSAEMTRVDSLSINCSCFGCFLSPLNCYYTVDLGINCLINFEFLFFNIDFRNEAIVKDQLAFFSLVQKTKAFQYL